MNESNRAVARQELTCIVWMEKLDVSGFEGVARAVDISSKGAGLLLAEPVTAGATVRLEFLVPPTNLRLHTTGNVVHSRMTQAGQYRVGIAFDEPPTLADEEES